MQIVGAIMGITGSFVEECVGRVKQPEGGYIPLRMFEVNPRSEGGMGLHSPDVELFQSVDYLGIYNPRLDESYLISVGDISKTAIDAVEKLL